MYPFDHDEGLRSIAQPERSALNLEDIRIIVDWKLERRWTPGAISNDRFSLRQ
jgi:hypothetical protein